MKDSSLDEKNNPDVIGKENNLGYQKPDKKPLKLIIVSLIILLLVAFGFYFLSRSRGSGSGTEETSPTPFLPEADPRIEVDLKPGKADHWVLLTVANYPDDVKSIEYELTYKSDRDGITKVEGITGTIRIQNNEKNISRDLYLGTESSGKFTPHKLSDNKGKLTLKFNSDKGASRFQKEYDLP